MRGYLTTEYCTGGSLDHLLAERGGRLPADEAVPLTLQALRGLEHAHDHGVIHRDLTPSNILLDGSMTAKIADYGIGKAFDQAGLSGLTRTGATAGKPMLMPRQQVVNFRKAPPAVDVWALAACLYHALTTGPPHPQRRHRGPARPREADPRPVRQDSFVRVWKQRRSALESGRCRRPVTGGEGRREHAAPHRARDRGPHPASPTSARTSPPMAWRRDGARSKTTTRSSAPPTQRAVDLPAAARA